jgi:hypothetical protein
LISEALHKADHGRRKLARSASLQYERAERSVRTEQWNDKRSVEPCLDRSVSKGIAPPFAEFWNGQRLSFGNCFTQPRIWCSDVEFAEPLYMLLVEPSRLSELDPVDIVTIVEDRTRVGAGELDGALNDDLEHGLEIKGGADRPADLAQSRQVAVARLHLLKEPRVLDGDDGLVGEGLQQGNIRIGERVGFRVCDLDGAYDLTLELHRYHEQSPIPAAARDIPTARRNTIIKFHITYQHRDAVTRSEPYRRIPVNRKRIELMYC